MDETLVLEIPSGLMEIIDDLASSLGITREEAAMHFLRNDAIHWHAAMKRVRAGD